MKSKKAKTISKSAKTTSKKSIKPAPNTTPESSTNSRHRQLYIWKTDLEKGKYLDCLKGDNILVTDDNTNDIAKIRIAVNNYHIMPIHSNYTKYIHSPKLLKLERDFTTKTCHQNSLIYPKLHTKTINKLKYKVLTPADEIYKTIPGFLHPQNESTFISTITNPYKPMWFGNSHVVYGLARKNYYPINAYIPQEDLLLLDLFDTRNLEILLLDVLAKNPANILVINDVKLMLGYGVTPTEQLLHYRDCVEGNKLNNITLFTEPKYFMGSYFECQTEKIVGLNPFSTFEYNYITIINLVNALGLAGVKFDGIINRQVASTLDKNGIYTCEEIILTRASFDKLKRNTESQMDWLGSTVEFTIPADGFLFRNIFNMRTLFSPDESFNSNFQIVNFWNKYRTMSNMLSPKITKTKHGLNVFVFDVNMFLNLNLYTDYETNFNNILGLLGKYINSVDYICLINYEWMDPHNFDDNINKFMESAGLANRYETYNGYSKMLNKMLKMVVYSRKKATDKIIAYTNFRGQPFNSLLLSTGNKKLLFMGLDHSKTQIFQLRGLFIDKPDVIVGRNINVNDPAFNILGKIGYKPANTGYGYMQSAYDAGPVKLFVRNGNKTKINSFGVVKCNYTDHLPYFFTVV